MTLGYRHGLRPQPLEGVTTYYVNAGGDDRNSGLRRDEPWKTLDPFTRRLYDYAPRIPRGSFVQACLTDLSPVNYDFTLSDLEVELGAGVDVYGEAFMQVRSADAVTAYAPAAVTTFGVLTCAGGLGTNNRFRGKVLRILSGNAQGLLCTIAGHTDTAIYLSGDWASLWWTIAPSDTFDIAGPMAGVNPVLNSIAGGASSSSFFTGLTLANVRLGTGFVAFGQCYVQLLGVEIPGGTELDILGGRVLADPFFAASTPNFSGYAVERLPFGATGTPVTPIPGYLGLQRQATIAGWGVGGNGDIAIFDNAIVSLRGTAHVFSVSGHNEASAAGSWLGGALTGGAFAKRQGSRIDITSNFSRTFLAGAETPVGAALYAGRGASIAYGGCDFTQVGGTMLYADTEGQLLEMRSTYGSNSCAGTAAIGAHAGPGGVIRFQDAPPFVRGAGGADIQVNAQPAVAAASIALNHGIVDPDGTGARVYCGGG